ncbi:DUF1613-domain-containing protein [Polyplosphaeria fusca]|uniref:tRNA (uracil-O(2)-)-methyltransferase n=1 Tax=Polyplosphaeria fusca TaxID=682080 RepID=A0A9P4R3Q4_9PLEO|nr:DUF1613-domain-containing protein [Polyplosphaeria fusca]
MAHYYGQHKPKGGHKDDALTLDIMPPLRRPATPSTVSMFANSHHLHVAPANFGPHFFLDVSRNLLENPNLTASHLSRAELSYASFTDPTFNPSAQHPHELANIIKHLKPDHQPILVPGGVPGYSLEWTVVRKLIPRNPKLDKSLLQTCHLYTSTEPIVIHGEEGTADRIDAERRLIIYLPHVHNPDEIPFYHPNVRALAILYTYLPSNASSTSKAPGALSLFYQLFPTVPLSNRLERTALRMLEIIHKHSKGRMNGYVKRVHHDQIIGQKTFQDRYQELKGRYAKTLVDAWVEQTPAEKHVFEDLGIAAFLIEVWIEMYGTNAELEKPKSVGEEDGSILTVSSHVSELHIDAEDERSKKARQNFPGFVDIGCGNGLLVYILNDQGWHGWGFDARRRKTWDTFPSSYTDKLKEMLLIPSVLDPEQAPSQPPPSKTPSHDGIFVPGTFLIANHADELTIWTPMLAHLSSSPFLAIPCCSHNFAGERFRAPSSSSSTPTPQDPNNPSTRPGKQVSAYASFCSHVTGLTEKVGCVAEREYLRIPSTRNMGILGRKRINGYGGEVRGAGERMEDVRKIVGEEMGGKSMDVIRRLWVERGDGLTKGKGGGH